MAVIETKPITIDSLIDEEESQFLAEECQSRLPERRSVRRSLAGGATSNWMIARPAAVWVSHGLGSRVWDVDGTEYVDLHGGYGVMVAGHANPAIVAAVQRRVTQGTHFAQPTDDSIVVAQRACRAASDCRCGGSTTRAPKRRWMPSISCAPSPDATRSSRSRASYHGHHDSTMVVAVAQPRHARPGRRSASRRRRAEFRRRWPTSCTWCRSTISTRSSACFGRIRGTIAGMIMEPMMMNAGIIPPQPGYLEGVRELTRRYGVLLTFDEVKTGLSVHPGGDDRSVRRHARHRLPRQGARRRAAVRCHRWHRRRDVGDRDGRYDQVGTFNGNPLTMAAARAMLTEVLTDDAYRQADARSQAMFDRATETLRQSRCSGLRIRLRLQGFVGVQRDAGAQLSRVPGHGHRSQPSSLPRSAQRWRLHGAVGQERAVDDLTDAHRRRRRPVLRATSTDSLHSSARRPTATLTITPPADTAELINGKRETGPHHQLAGDADPSRRRCVSVVVPAVAAVVTGVISTVVVAAVVGVAGTGVVVVGVAGA